MASISILYRDLSVLLDDDDVRLVEGLRIYLDSSSSGQYAVTYNPKTKIREKLHRVVLGLSKKDGLIVDHVNGDRLDNRKSNLRIASHQQNRVNAHRLNKNNSSGVRGVFFDRGKTPRAKRWTASIVVNGKHITIGRFLSKEEAYGARATAEMKYFNEVCPGSITCPA